MRLALVSLALLLPLAAQAPDYSTLGAAAFRAGYPLVEMARWRDRFLQAGGKQNQFFHRRDTLDPLSGELLPNTDALYSSAWLDLSAGPVTLSMPATGSRYVILQLISAWAETFAVLHRTELGADGTTLYLTPPGWAGTTPAGMRRLPCPAALVVVWLRLFAASEGEIPVLRGLQDRFVLQASPAFAALSEQRPVGFLEDLAQLLPLNPPPAILRPVFETLAPLGIRLDRSGGPAGLSVAARREVDAAIDRSQRALPEPVRQPRRLDGGWAWFDAGQAAPASLEQRILRARAGSGAFAALPASDSMYAIGYADADGKPLQGDRDYEIMLDASGLPPAGGFWSISVYTASGRPVPRARHSISSVTPGLNRDENGAVRITLGPALPLAQQSNWLPTKPGEGVRVVLRIYQPEAPVLNGTWHAPLIVAVTAETP